MMETLGTWIMYAAAIAGLGALALLALVDVVGMIRKMRE